MSHTQHRVGSRKEGIPPNTWTGSGQTPALPTIVKQPRSRQPVIGVGVAHRI